MKTDIKQKQEVRCTKLQRAVYFGKKDGQTLWSQDIMATEYRKEGEKNFTRSTSRISANKYHNIYRFSQGQGALLHMLCMCESSAIRSITHHVCQNTRIIDWEKEKKERKKAIFSQGGSRKVYKSESKHSNYE